MQMQGKGVPSDREGQGGDRGGDGGLCGGDGTHSGVCSGLRNEFLLCGVGASFYPVAKPASPHGLAATPNPVTKRHPTSQPPLLLNFLLSAYTIASHSPTRCILFNHVFLAFGY